MPFYIISSFNDLKIFKEMIVKGMDTKLIIFSMAGGLALFLFGIKVLSDGLQMALGDKIKSLLEKPAGSKLAGVGIGAAVTAIIQSSGITAITIMGLINAGLITLAQSIPIIMGANIGTTITTQLIAFNIGKISLPVIAIGFLMTAVGNREIIKYVGQITLGFGILFLGMNLMSTEAELLVKNQQIVNFLAGMGKTPLLGILAGTGFTAVIQSSSATSGLVISMAQTAGKSLIDLKTAMALILGANIGTCATALLASIKSSPESKRAALAGLVIKIIGVALVFPVLNQFAVLIQKTSPDLARQIAYTHLFFNLAVTLLLLPVTGLILFIVTRIIPAKEDKKAKGVKYLEEHTLRTPIIALDMAEKETIRMARISLNMIEASRLALFERDKKYIGIVKDQEKIVDFLDDKIEEFLSEIKEDALPAHRRTDLAILNHVISDIERIGDHANNICELAETREAKNIRFSDDAFDELRDVFDKADDSLELVIKLIQKFDESVGNRIMEIEKEVDKMVIQMEENHYERLDHGACTAEGGPLYLDILRNLERITDHTHNIAAAMHFGF